MLPILCVRSVEKDSVRFSDASENFWDSSFALKLPAISFSVLKNLMKNAKLVLVLRRSFLVFLIRFAFVYVYGMF